MASRFVMSVVFLSAAAAVGSAAAQAPSAADTSSGVPRLPWGDPDLQGAWDYRTITPLQRDPALGDRAFFTEQEIAELEGRAAERLDEPPGEDAPTNLVHAQYVTDPGRFIDAAHRTSLIIDPPDGRMPDMTPAARARREAGRAAGPEHPSEPWRDRSMLERCVTRGMPQAILPGLYNNNIQIAQAPDHVAIVHEMVHETRIVPLDGRDFTGIPGYMGESRGHWEGDTLVVETRHFNDEVSYRGSTSDLRLIERYTRTGPDTIAFRMTVEDPSTWTQPWTVAYQMRPTEGGLFEYACHEGNRGIRNILRNMQSAERTGASGN